MRKICTVLMTLLFVLGAVGSANADPFGDEMLQGKTAVVRFVDNEICMVVWHDGSETEAGTAVTSATFSSGTDAWLRFCINGSLDTRISSDGVIDITAATGTGDDFGEVVDAVEAAVGWHCRLVDVLRADSTVHLASITNVKDSSCFQNAGVTISRDQAASDAKVYQFGAGLVKYGYGYEDLSGWQVFLDAIYCNIVHTDGDYSVSVYICDDLAKTETVVFTGKAAATGVDYWWPTYGPRHKPILAGKAGQRIVVRTLNDTADDPEALSMIGILGSIVYVH